MGCGLGGGGGGGGGDDDDDASGPAELAEFDRSDLNYDQFSGMLDGVPVGAPGVGIARHQSEDISPDDWH